MQRAELDQPAEAADWQPDAPAPVAGDAERGSRSPSHALTASAARAARAGAAAPSRPARRRPLVNPAPRPLTLQADPFTTDAYRATHTSPNAIEPSFRHPQAPARVRTREPQHQLPDLLGDRGSTRAPFRIRPPSPYK